MSLRRILAEQIDPELRAEIRELRDTAAQADERRAATEILLLKTRTQHMAQIAVLEALLRSAEAETRQAQLDVASLLEDAARCAHEHHDT